MLSKVRQMYNQAQGRLASVKKIQNVVGNIDNLRSQATGAISNFGGELKGMMGGILPGAEELKKVTAKIANKSPFDLDQVSPTAHLGKQNSKFNYGTLVYPEETQNLGDGHYIIFDIIPLDKSTAEIKDADGKNKNIAFGGKSGKSLTLLGEGRRSDVSSVLKERKKGTNATNILRQRTNKGSGLASRHNTISDSIVLYTPQQSHNFSYKVETDEAEMGTLGNFANAINNFLNSEGSFGERFKDLLGDAAGAGGIVGRKLIESSINMILPGFSSFNVQRTGVAINPNLELVFKSVPFRNFDFSFDLAPRNKGENDTCHNIIKLFKFHMLPENAGQGRLAIPSEFQITYMYRDDLNGYIPKISRCMLTSFDVDYAPNQKFHTLRSDENGAPPQMMKIKLAFTEREIMTKETIALGH